MSNNESHHEDLGKALGRIASGVYIVTVRRGEHRQGLLATWIAQCSFSPPLVTLAVNKERPVLEHLEKPGSLFAVNILTKQNMDIFKAFARPHVEDEVRFSELAIADDTENGVVFNDVASALICRTHSTIDGGDHTLVVAEVTAGKTFAAETEPMVHLRNNGFKY